MSRRSAGPSEAGGGGGLGGFRPPNNLLKFANFVSEKGCKAKVVRKKIQTCMYSWKLPESIKNAISFDVIQVKKIKIFMGRLSFVVILCFRQ